MNGPVGPTGCARRPGLRATCAAAAPRPEHWQCLASPEPEWPGPNRPAGRAVPVGDSECQVQVRAAPARTPRNEPGSPADPAAIAPPRLAPDPTPAENDFLCQEPAYDHLGQEPAFDHFDPRLTILIFRPFWVKNPRLTILGRNSARGPAASLHMAKTHAHSP